MPEQDYKSVISEYGKYDPQGAAAANAVFNSTNKENDFVSGLNAIKGFPDDFKKKLYYAKFKKSTKYPSSSGPAGVAADIIRDIPEALSNLVPSTGKQIKDIGSGVVSMARGVVGPAAMTTYKMLFESPESKKIREEEEAASPPESIGSKLKTIGTDIWEGNKDYYGNFHENFRKDPAKALSDLSMVLSLGQGAVATTGKLAKVTGAISKTGKAAGVLEKTSSVLGQTADWTNPLTGPIRLAQTLPRNGQKVAQVLSDNLGTAGGTKPPATGTMAGARNAGRDLAEGVSDILTKPYEYTRNKYAKALGINWDFDDAVRDRILDFSINRGKRVYAETPGVPYSISVADYEKMKREINVLNDTRKTLVSDPAIAPLTVNPATGRAFSQEIENLRKELRDHFTDRSRGNMGEVEKVIDETIDGWISPTDKSGKSQIYGRKLQGYQNTDAMTGASKLATELSVTDLYGDVQNLNRRLETHYDAMNKSGGSTSDILKHEIEAALAKRLRELLDTTVSLVRPQYASVFKNAGTEMANIMELKDIVRAHLKKYENVPIVDQSGYMTMQKGKILQGAAGLSPMYAVFKGTMGSRPVAILPPRAALSRTPIPATIRKGVNAVGATGSAMERGSEIEAPPEPIQYPSQQNVQSFERPKNTFRQK